MNQQSLCKHDSCIYSSLLGFRQGLYYGAKIRFFHALIMTMLFRQTTFPNKLKIIFSLTYEHSRKLGIYVFLYKSIVCTLAKLKVTSVQMNTFISGLVTGYFIFGRDKSSVNQQIVLYLLSRDITGIAANLQNKSYLPKNIKFYPFLAAICWAIVMYLYEDDPECLQSSLTASMNFLYRESDTPVVSWKQLLPVPDFIFAK